MDDQTLLARIETWRSMPDHVLDVRDLQLVKTRAYPHEEKAQFFHDLYDEMSQEQRQSLPYIMEDCPDWVFCKLFLEADAEEQERLIDRATQTRRLDAGTISSYANSIKSKQDIAHLREGLAATVLLNGNDDYRDILTSLASLWVAAAHADIDPLPYFQAAALTAHTDDPYGTGSARHMLANFHNYAIFKDQVEPHLPDTFR
jgi:hypothetical protein